MIAFRESTTPLRFRAVQIRYEVIGAELEMSKRPVLQYVGTIRRLKAKADEAAKTQAKDKEVAA